MKESALTNDVDFILQKNELNVNARARSIFIPCQIPIFLFNFVTLHYYCLEMLLLESPHNEKFKRLLRLISDNSYRRKQGVFVVEGLKEIRSAVQFGYDVEDLYVDEKYRDRFEPAEFASIRTTLLSHSLFSRLVYREDASIVIATIREPELHLKKIKFSNTPLIVILEEIEKPGNIGAILRTCDAVGVDAVIASQRQHNFFHPNVIRSSVGTVFTMQLGCADPDEILEWCKSHDIRIYSAALQTDAYYTDVDYKHPTAFVMGSEDKGLKDFWRKASDNVIKIPMLGHNDSLNVSVSAAVLLYEARRQRGF